MGLKITAITIGVTLVIGIYLGITIFDGDFAEYVNESEEWCSERDGELVNERVVGDAGGLYCQLPNGTSVPMDEVVSINRSEVS